jgi:hypothetical protein
LGVPLLSGMGSIYFLDSMTEAQREKSLSMRNRRVDYPQAITEIRDFSSLSNSESISLLLTDCI